MDEDNEKLDEHAMDETTSSLCRHSVLRCASFCTSVLPEIHVRYNLQFFLWLKCQP